MTSVEEAEVFFHARGCRTMAGRNLVVFARGHHEPSPTDPVCELRAPPDIGPCYILCPQEAAWGLLGLEQIDGMDAGVATPLGSLADAVNAILAQILAWRAANPE